MYLQRPTLGWNSWNTFGNKINSKLIRETADLMVSSGLREAGYTYLVIDDCWSLRQRDKRGNLVPDPELFPEGMKALGDYIHDKGLQFGMYSCVGTQTCAGYPGSFGHEFQDAATFASWGVDYLKYDYCYKPMMVDGCILYRRMGLALKNCGRDIVFDACSWGYDDTRYWIRTTGANQWRSTLDLVDSWESLKNMILKQNDQTAFGGMGCFNDMDMLIVGMYGSGNVGITGCTDEEYRLHYSLWALMGSPLMIGCDLREMNDTTREILTNPEVIAIDQDAQSQPFRIPNGYFPEEQPVWVKQLDNGDYAMVYANLHDDGVNICACWWDLGLPPGCGYGFAVRDVWKHEDLGVYENTFCVGVPAHSCRMFRLALTKL